MSSSASSSRRRLGTRGTSTVEFSLVIVMLMLAFTAIVEVGRWEATRVALRTATAEALRIAMLDPDLAGCAAPWTRVSARVPVLEAGRITLCVTRGTNSGLQQVSVTASYAYAFGAPVLGAASRTMTDSGLVRF